jgi:hypothetical protein
MGGVPSVYEIERKEKEVLVKRSGHTMYSAPLESFIIYKPKGDETVVSKVGDLTDDKLLLALATAVQIPDLTKLSSRK